MKRDQTETFGTKLRGLLCGRSEDRKRGGIIVHAIETLTDLKRQGQHHPAENTLSGMARVHYLRLYNKGESIRVYFTITDDVIWMLDLNPNKRTDDVTDAEMDALAELLRWTEEQQ